MDLELLKQKSQQLDAIVITGPTALGKTRLAANLAHFLDGALISADSRQVYKHMNIGTGKDLKDLIINGKSVPFYLIDLLDPNAYYDLHQYQNDFEWAYMACKAKNQLPILCGGSGLYLESILKKNHYPQIPQNFSLRANLESQSLSNLQLAWHCERLVNPSLNELKADTSKRLVRALEVACFLKENPDWKPKERALPNQFCLFVLSASTSFRQQRVKQRLQERLQNGLIDEVESLLQMGVSEERLLYHGLEYKFICLYVMKKLSYQTMYHNLQTAIFQFSKRQQTWFNGMQKRGFNPIFIDATLPFEKQCQIVYENILQPSTLA